ncbi:MAG: histidinol dehydrogenase [Deltaproteobacteria bacterium]
MITPLCDGSVEAGRRLEKLRGRAVGGGRVARDVARIIADVRRRGDKAVFEYTQRLDGVRLSPRRLQVGPEEIKRACAGLDSETYRALKKAHTRIGRFHRLQRERGFELREAGVRTEMRITPLEKVGVYVPGGRASYPSSVLMNVVPAKIAGVADITVVTPPSVDGVSAAVLAAADLAGATRVLQIGGAQAIAALAYGTRSIERVDKIVGPGNAYVAEAKRAVFGQVDIDMVAGPTEVLIVADGTARADFVAADMLAQAEHDPLAASLCVTTSRRLAAGVVTELKRQLPALERRAVARRSLARFGTILLVRSMSRAIEVANQIAPEHLELLVAEPRRLLGRIKNAGAIFLGQYSTEPLGDYIVGANHVLPTGGSARFASPLGVYDFVKRTSIIEVSRSGLRRLAGPAIVLAGSEGLGAHALAVSRRLG